MAPFIVLACVIAMGASAAAAQTHPVVVGSVQQITVGKGDTWTSLGARFGVDPDTLKADNRTSTARLVAGHPVTIDNRHIVPAAFSGDAIVVNVPQRMLYVPGSSLVAVPIAVGRPTWPTPLVEFVVLTKEIDPTWNVPASIQAEALRKGVTLPAAVPPGPDNPLGKYWIGLSVDSVGIHGTNAPSSIFRAVTHGCIRVHPDNIEMVFNAVRPRMAGVIAYEPILLAQSGQDVLLEVHPDVYRRGPRDPMAHVRTAAEQLGLRGIDWSRVSQVLAARAGVARVISQP